MKTRVLQILRENDTFVSGQQLCEQLGVSRTAIWKVIKSLREDGYDIAAVTNKGYRIVAAPCDLLNANEIKSRLKTEEIGCEIYYRDEIDSTNDWIKILAAQEKPSGVVCVADMQSKGKGRRGRVWSSPSGTSLSLSILLRPQIQPAEVSPLTLVMGLSVAQALNDVADISAGIKWPNDVVVGGRKICGILTEMSAQIDYVDYLVIGVGVNVNHTDFAEEIKETATSVRLETGKIASRAEIAAALLNRFEENYRTYLKTCDLDGLLAAYHDVLVNKEQTVRVLSPGNEFTGTALGIDKKGQLLVRREDGSLEAVYAGEVSVRGIYGYTN